jgi:hypothetical protein
VSQFDKSIQVIYKVVDCDAVKNIKTTSDLHVSNTITSGTITIAGNQVNSVYQPVLTNSSDDISITSHSTITVLPGFSTIAGGKVVLSIDPCPTGGIYVANPPCTSTAKSASLDSLNKIMDVQELDLKNGINIFPNPNSGSFTISLNNEKANRIIIYNAFGQAVEYDRDKPGSSDVIEISLPEAKPGIYFVLVKGKVNTYTSKIVVQ